tara:strand:+ start:565 stop:1290 length:726 start_codon:yes stop_codon:yes gene_type:complete
MPTFQIGDTYVEADTKEQAERVCASLNMGDKDEAQILLRREHGGGDIIRVPSNGHLEIWVKNGKSIEYAGKIQGGSGIKILRAAIESVNVSDRERGKLAHAVKNAQRERLHADENMAVTEFEKSVLPAVKSLYKNVMERMEATTLAYKLEIIDGLANESVNEIRDRNWLPILFWFRDKVLDSEESLPLPERRTFYSLRKAFVKGAARMSKDDVRNSSTIKLTADDGKRNNDYWGQYAKTKE